MFSLIISIIAIVLVAIAALATIYYGGSAFNSSASTAKAARILNESVQLQGSVEAYKTDHNAALPASMADLISGGYLNGAPSGSWSFATDSVQSIVLDAQSCLLADARLGYNLSVVPSCSDPVYANVTICCQ